MTTTTLPTMYDIAGMDTEYAPFDDRPDYEAWDDDMADDAYEWDGTTLMEPNCETCQDTGVIYEDAGDAESGPMLIATYCDCPVGHKQFQHDDPNGYAKATDDDRAFAEYERAMNEAEARFGKVGA